MHCYLCKTYPRGFRSGGSWRCPKINDTVSPSRTSCDHYNALDKAPSDLAEVMVHDQRQRLKVASAAIDTLYHRNRWPISKGESFDILSSDQTYLVSCRSEFFKIGVAANPMSRLNEMQTSNPYQLKIIATCPGGHKFERQLHNKYTEQHVRGEWFALSRKQVGEIKRLFRDRQNERKALFVNT